MKREEWECGGRRERGRRGYRKAKEGRMFRMKKRKE